jgi:hypothetical protein
MMISEWFPHQKSGSSTDTILTTCLAHNIMWRTELRKRHLTQNILLY